MWSFVSGFTHLDNIFEVCLHYSTNQYFLPMYCGATFRDLSIPQLPADDGPWGCLFIH